MIRAKKPVDGTDHECIEQNLSAYLDGELLPQEKHAVEQHLATCQECRWDLETLRQVVQWTSELPVLAVPRVCTIPVQPVRAPRRRSIFLPALQGATALVALLLFFAVAGDFLLGGMRFASAPQTVVMQEEAAAQATMAPAEAPASEVIVTQEVEAIVEVTKAVEAEVARKAMTEPPPPSASQATSVAEPAAAAAAMAPAATPEAAVTEAPGVGGLMGSEPATAEPQLEVTLAGTLSTTEATADMVQAAGVPTPTMPVMAMLAVTPTSPGTTTAIPQAPTVVVEAQPELAPAPAEGETASPRALRQPGLTWWQVGEYALAGILVVLVIATLIATIRSRRYR